VDPFDAVVRAIARFWIWFFFERVEVRNPERVSSTGPVLLCINHPNNLLDSLLAGSVLPRKVHYLATAALFRNPLIARFLVALGVIPVYRKDGRLRQSGPQRGDVRGVRQGLRPRAAHRHLSRRRHPLGGGGFLLEVRLQ
jgi:1-acyl-sn-glycerol-3-phosphate acyltransferase